MTESLNYLEQENTHDKHGNKFIAAYVMSGVFVPQEQKASATIPITLSTSLMKV